MLVATGWQHAGYIMLLYLAGLKGSTPLREAAAVDGASQWQTFFPLIFPVLGPINLILEIIAALVTQNIIGEASRIGFGSALATIMLVISSDS